MISSYSLNDSFSGLSTGDIVTLVGWLSLLSVMSESINNSLNQFDKNSRLKTRQVLLQYACQQNYI